KLAEGQVALGKYADDINQKLAPAVDQAAQRQQNTRAATDGLRGALEALSSILATPIRYFADLGQQAADLWGKISGLTDRFGWLAWGIDHVAKPALRLFTDELIYFIESGLNVATAPLVGFIRFWDDVARAIDWASQKLGIFQRQSRQGAGGGGGLGGDFT